MDVNTFLRGLRDVRPDSNDNYFRAEGIDRCYCGCKYWEHDRCIDCGGTEVDPAAS